MAEGLHRQRFDGTEQTFAESCLDAATLEIDAWIDWRAAPPEGDDWNPTARALVKRVCVARAVEWWKASDAAFGAIGYTDIGVLRAPREAFARHGMMLIPLKEQWGIA